MILGHDPAFEFQLWAVVGAYVLVRHGLRRALSRLAKHRGISHSIPTCLVWGALTYLYYPSDRHLLRLEVADIGPPSSQESIVRASRCNRTNEGSLWARVYGPSRDSYAYYHGKHRDCASQPMLMGRELRRGIC